MPPAVKAVVKIIRTADPDGHRIGQVLRSTFDQIYDGQRTGHYRWENLAKTEKTHFGSLVEINLCREFRGTFLDGGVMDFRIGGVEVDCKYSQDLYGWMIPREANGHLCLLLWAEDSYSPRWSMGLICITEEHLSKSENRDCKRRLNKNGQHAITWIFKDEELPPNVLVQLDEEKVARIMQARSGQQRVNELFRVALHRRIGRAVIATVARQDDFMKRVRENGGARTPLRREGIIILGHFDAHAAIARKLHVPVPISGELVSVRVVPASADEAFVAEIGGKLWRVAKPTDSTVQAPILPKTKRTLRPDRNLS